MEIEVFLERLPENGFRVTCLSPAAVAEGPTREAALDLMRQQLSNQLSRAEVVRIEVPTRAENPWLAMAGRMVDHPDAEDIKKNMRDYRAQADAEWEQP